MVYATAAAELDHDILDGDEDAVLLEELPSEQGTGRTDHSMHARHLHVHHLPVHLGHPLHHHADRPWLTGVLP